MSSMVSATMQGQTTASAGSVVAESTAIGVPAGWVMMNLSVQVVASSGSFYLTIERNGTPVYSTRVVVGSTSYGQNDGTHLIFWGDNVPQAVYNWQVRIWPLGGGAFSATVANRNFLALAQQ
jgi:hypothetical protein